MIGLAGPEAGLDGLVGELSSFEDSATLKSWSASKREHLRVELVRRRDAGYPQEAADGFRKAHAIWPDDPSFPLELLVISQAYPALSIDGLAIGSLLTPDCRAYPPIALLIALTQAQAGSVDDAREAFVRIASEGSSTIAPFLGQFIELGRLVITHAAMADDGGLDDLLALYLVVIDRNGRLEDVTRGVAFFNSLRMSDPTDRVTRALLHIRHGITQEGRAVLVMMLNANRRYAEARNVVMEYIDVLPPTSPSLVKAALVTASSLRDGVLERVVLTSYDPIDPDATLLDRLKSSEIKQRRSALGADRPINLFIGFFGQMRESEKVLPKTIQTVREELVSSKCGPFQIGYGLATWRKSGNRHLRADQSILFFGQLIADEAKPLMDTRFGVTGADVAPRLPNLIATLLARFGNREVSDVTQEGALALLPSDSCVFIDDEGQTEQAVHEAVARSGIPFPNLPMNQFKMWSRIARLRDAIAVHEERTQTDVDVCVLLRTDFEFMYGVFGHLVCRAWSPYNRSVVFGDHDPHAEYIEGLGDRYMAFPRQRFDDVFSVYRWSLDALAGGERRRRLQGHEALPALLFERGALCEPTTDLAYGLNRGLLPDDDLLTALMMDRAVVSDGELGALLDQAIGALKTRLGVS